MKKAWGTLLVVLAIHANVVGQSTSVEAWVDYSEQADGFIKLTGIVKNLTGAQGEYNYTMTVSKSDEHGKSSNTQSGVFSLMGEEVETLSTVNLKLAKNQKITAELRVLLGHIEVARDVFETNSKSPESPTFYYSAQKEVVHDSVSLAFSSVNTQEIAVTTDPSTIQTPESSYSAQREVVRDSVTLAFSSAAEQELAEQPGAVDMEEKTSSTPTVQEEVKRDSIGIAIHSTPTPEIAAQKDAAPIDDLEIDGLIIDETRSKAARDFYGLFYRKWQAPKEAENYTITLKEYPTRGRVARVGIEVNGKLIFQPVLQPRQDMLELVSDQAIRVVQQHLLEQKQMKTQMESEDHSGSGLF